MTLQSYVPRLIAVLLLAAWTPRIATGQHVREALLAQVQGLGGCADIDLQRETASPYFPGIRLIQGACQLEHGDTAFPLVGVDRDGLVYVLDSPSAFSFLVLVHPPTGIDSSNVLDYARSALQMMGQLSARDTVVKRTDSIPNIVLVRHRVSRAELLGSRVLRSLREGFLVSVTTVSSRRVTNNQVMVYPKSGGVRFMERKEWPESGG
jgi:hypothetical protein